MLEGQNILVLGLDTVVTAIVLLLAVVCVKFIGKVKKYAKEGKGLVNEVWG